MNNRLIIDGVYGNPFTDRNTRMEKTYEYLLEEMQDL